MSAIDRLLSCKGNPVEFFEHIEAARAEVEKLRAANELAFELFGKSKAENDRLRNENKSTYCAYCSASFERTDNEIALIRDHIKVCEFHPMRKLEAEKERLTNELSGKTGELEELKNGIAFYIEAGKVLSDEIKTWKENIAEVRTKFLESQRVVGELTAERDRYKAALKYISDCHDGETYHDTFFAMKDAARAALAESEKK